MEPRNPKWRSAYGHYTTTAAFVALQRLRRLVTLAGGDARGLVSLCRLAPVQPVVGRVVVLVSESVHEAVVDDFAFGAVREVKLKGFNGTHRVYPVELSG